MCWQTIAFLCVLWAQALSDLLWNNLFQWFLYGKQPWKIETVSLSGTNSRHAYCPCKSLCFCNTPHCVCRCPLTLFALPFGNWGSENGHKKMKIFWQLLLLSVTKYFDSDPGVLCLLSGSINCGRLRVKEKWIFKGKLGCSYLKRKEWMLAKRWPDICYHAIYVHIYGPLHLLIFLLSGSCWRPSLNSKTSKFLQPRNGIEPLVFSFLEKCIV